MSRVDFHEQDLANGRVAAMGAPEVGGQGVLRVMIRWWWIPVALSLAGLITAGVILWYTPVTYEGVAYVQIKGAVPGMTREDIAAVEASNLETECGVMTSSTVLRAALALRGDPGFRTLSDPDAPKDGDSPRQMPESARIRYLKEHVQANVVKGRSIVCLTCESPYPEDASDLANLITAAYRTHRSTRAEDSAAEYTRILEHDQTLRSNALQTLEQEIADFKKRNKRHSFEPGGGQVLTSKHAGLSGTLTQVRVDVIEAEAVFKDALRMAYGPHVDLAPWLTRKWTEQSLDPAVSPEETTQDGNDAPVDQTPSGSFFPRTQFPERVRTLAMARRSQGVMIMIGEDDARLGMMLESAQMERDALAKLVPAGHEGLKALEAKIASLGGRWSGRDERYAQAYLALVAEQYFSAVQREQNIRVIFEEAQRAVADYNEQAAEFRLLESRRHEIEVDLDVLRTKIKTVSVQGRAGGLNVEVLEPAMRPEKPSKPNWPRVLIMGTVAGLMLGIGLAVVIDWLDHRIRSIEEIAAVLGVPVLGVVPDMGGKEDELIHRAQHVLEAPDSGVAEAVRLIRTSMMFSSEGAAAKSILVTSPNRGDGKSMVLANLGIAMAQAGRRTLIVDTDFRRPCQNQIFELTGPRGLATVLAGDGSIEDAVRRTPVEGLTVLPCGEIPPNPSEMLNSQTFRKIVIDLAASYDCVLFDSPPTGPVTDALILGALCDCALLVVRAEETTRRSAEYARDSLLSVGAKLMGVVINAVPARRDGTYSLGGYGGYGNYRVPEGDSASK